MLFALHFLHYFGNIHKIWVSDQHAIVEGELEAFDETMEEERVKAATLLGEGKVFKSVEHLSDNDAT